MASNKKEYINFLTQKFEETKFIEFVSDLLNLAPEDINTSLTELKSLQKQFVDTVDYYKYVANYISNADKIGTFIVKLTSAGSQNARTSQRTFISTLLNKYDLDAALVAFYQDDESSWRLSFVKKELNFTDKGIKVDLTPAKRFSYLVGEHEAVHTAQQYLLSLLEIQDRKVTLADIEKVFDVEKVTKEFFEKYKEKYLGLKEFLDNNQDFITESENCDFTSEEFAKKLMGQIVFLYFLQKKGWLGVQIVPDELSKEEYNELSNQTDSVCNNLLEKYYNFNEDKYVINKQALKNEAIKDNINNFVSIFKNTKYDKPWGTGDKQFVMNMFKKSRLDHKNNFFDEYLEPFFYTGLNEKRDNQYFALFNCKIPFLNGGLFEPLNNYRWSSAKFNIPDEIFWNGENGILDIFNLYNFTIDEEEPLEKDIAVDPEMLGKIFENLLDVSDRKDTGSFYTPREIVHHMCQEVLANYLCTKNNLKYDEVIEFIKYGDLICQSDCIEVYNSGNHILSDSIWNNIVEIDLSLLNVKVCDPAVGSGAFPLGILNEIVRLRDNLSSYMIIQNDLGIIDFSELTEEQKQRDIYSLKLLTIKNSIYAVDLELSAVEIAKLRLWLSLIVDYDNEEEPKPLPNLDCKIVQGNSLVDEFEGTPLFSNKVIKNSMRKNAAKVNIQQNMFGEAADIHIQEAFGFDEVKDDKTDEVFEQIISLQKQYFNAHESTLKKSIKSKLESLQYRMVEESLKNNSSKLEKFKELEKRKKKPWFIWQLEFYDVFKDNNGGFDIIIGNPPYKTYGLRDNANLTVELKKYYVRKFINSAEYKINLYPMFMELAYSLGHTNSIISYIVPDSFLVGKYFSKIRRLILKESSIVDILLIKAKVFESASVGQSVVFLFQKKKNGQLMNISMCNELSEISKKNYITYNYKQDIFKSTYNNAFYMMFSKDAYELVNKIEKNTERKIKDYVKFRSGLISKIGQDKIKSNIPMTGNWGKGIFSGENVKKYRVTYTNQFLCYEKDIIKSGGIGTVSYFEPKLFVRQTGDSITCALDFENLLAINNVHIGNLLTGDIDDLYYICALLNSKVIDKYYKIISLEEGRAMAQIDIDTLINIPVPDNETLKKQVILKCKELYETGNLDLQLELDNLIDEMYNK